MSYLRCIDFYDVKCVGKYLMKQLISIVPLLESLELRYCCCSDEAFQALIPTKTKKVNENKNILKIIC
jgi:hypothetical protein